MQNDKASTYLGRFYLNTAKSGARYIKGRLGAATLLGFEKTLPNGDTVFDFTLVNEERKEKAPQPESRDADIGDSIPF